MFSSAHLTHKLLIRSKFAKVSLLLILNAASSVSVAGDSISLDTLLLVTSHEDVSRVTRGDETCAPLHGVTATEVQSSGWSVWRRGGAGRGGSHGRGRVLTLVTWHGVTLSRSPTWRRLTSPCHSRAEQQVAGVLQVAGRPVSGLPPPLPVSPGLLLPSHLIP